MKYPLIILLAALAVLSLAQAAYYHLQLPALMATSFDAAGYVRGWMPRAHFLYYQVVFTLGFAAFFGAFAFGVSLLPDALINLPHRTYWFDPARREDTRRRLVSLVLSSGCGVLAFLLFLRQRIFQANHDGTHELTPSFGVVLAVALVLIAGPLVRPLRRFGRKPPPD
jgi:hypothetical protein